MAKSLLKLKARQLRRRGESIKDISRLIGVAKSSVSVWCRDIELSKSQIEQLLNRKSAAVRLGQINGALVLKNRRLERVRHYDEKGKEQFKSLRRRDFYIAGLALYLAEGSKKSRQIDFINSDPLVMRFMMKWFRIFFNVPKEHFVFTVFINSVHKRRDKIIKQYWANLLRVPIRQFRKTTFVRTKQQKIYENHDQYFGTLRFRTLKSTELYYRILGLLRGLLHARHATT